MYSSNEGSEFRTLREYDIFHKRDCTGDDAAQVLPNWDVESISTDNEGNIVVVYSVDGVSTFYHCNTNLNLPWGQLQLRPNPDTCGCGEPVGVVGNAGISPYTKHLFGYSLLRANGPSDVFTIDLSQREPEEGGVLSRARSSSSMASPGVTRQWTRSEVGGLNPARFVQPELIRYKSFDGLSIPAFVYKPSKRKHNTAVPVIVHPHGGPEGQHRPQFKPFYQYLVLEMGICVIDPNVRGSNGYGKVFVTLDDAEKREDPSLPLIHPNPNPTLTLIVTLTVILRTL